MPDKFALIIAVENYQDSRFKTVKYANNDALAMDTALNLHGYNNRSILINHEATKTIIESRLRYLINHASIGDELLIFYAGHGFANSNQNFITCYDTQFDDKENTSIPLQFIMEQLNQCSCQRKIMFLDTCHSGAIADESTRGLYSRMSEQELRDFFSASEYCIAFASCKSDQESHGAAELSHGIWSHHVIEALLGNAPTSLARGGIITATSLQNYLSIEVPRSVRNHISGMKIQTPCVFGNSSQDFIVADITPILAERERQIQSQARGRQLGNIIFKGEDLGDIRSLSGFIRRVHFVPDAPTSSAHNFLVSISQKEFEEEIQKLYSLVKRKFGYKSRDVRVDPGYGIFSIICPDFDIESEIMINPDNPSEYIWRFELKNIRNQALIESDEFNETFRDYFNALELEFRDQINITELRDAIEDLENDDIDVEDEVGSDTCTITVRGKAGVFVVTPTTLKLEFSYSRPPKVMIQEFIETTPLLATTPIVEALPPATES